MTETWAGTQITPREYLETALRPLSGSGPSVEAKNQVRNRIGIGRKPACQAGLLRH